MSMTMAMATPLSLTLPLAPISSPNTWAPKCSRPMSSNLSLGGTRVYFSLGRTRVYFSGRRNFRQGIRIVKKHLTLKCKALSDGSQGAEGNKVYGGVYGPWTVEASDKLEVTLYRGGLVICALSFIVAASRAFLPDDSFARAVLQQNLDTLYALGAGSLGLSLILIHIYVTPIKRTLQILWSLGVIGSLATYLNLALPEGKGLVEYVMENPVAVWFVGPLFASLTGLVFKEGLCYGKLEAAGLTFVIPTLLLGHLTGLMGDNVKSGLLGVWVALFAVFAARKFTQPIKDDIGDKSIFMFNALSKEEKAVFLLKREEQTAQSINKD